MRAAFVCSRAAPGSSSTRSSGPDDQWLPPDHFQEEPAGEVARRTSPTNIGLLQLATLSAHDLGYAGLLSVVLRLRNTFETLDRMERHRGHFYNWYDTRDLTPLSPRYVSTVDSGNLAACLLAVKQGCLELGPGARRSGPPAGRGWSTRSTSCSRSSSAALGRRRPPGSPPSARASRKCARRRSR